MVPWQLEMHCIEENVPKIMCPVCGKEVETIEHLFLLFPWVSRCWFGCSLSLLVTEDQATCIKKWCEGIFLTNKVINEEGKALVAAICWGIWKGRCDWVFNSTNVDAVKVICTASALVSEVWRAKAVTKKAGIRGDRSKVVRKDCWILPEEGTVKINADGAFLKQSGCADIGIVCRDSIGAFLGGVGKKVVACSAFEAECLAVKEALQARDRFSMQKFCIEIDCEELFRHLIVGSDVGVEWQSAHTLKEVLLLIEGRPGIEFSLVARQSNGAADYLTAAGSRGMGPNGWLLSAPSLLIEILLADSINSSNREWQRDENQNASGACERNGVG